jgi:protein phosphatase
VSGQGPPRGDIVVHVFGKTDVGRTREHNEDCFVVADLTTMNATLQPEVRTHRPGDRGSLFMVADGMGGAAAGEIASALATDVVLKELDARWRQAPDHEPETFARALKAACETANARIHKYATEHPENRGMGTTATIAGFLGDTLYLAQVGDSRGYIIRSGVAQQITKDQSLMQKLVEAGELTVEEAEVSERRNIILQALGPEPIVKVDLTTQQVRRGDTLVLCSDGLSGQMRAEDIGRIVSEDPDLVRACRKLIDLANENGGPDNITVVAVRFEGRGLEVASDGEDVGHQAYTSQTERRITQPVNASAIPPENDEITAPTLALKPKGAGNPAPRGSGGSSRGAAGGPGQMSSVPAPGAPMASPAGSAAAAGSSAATRSAQGGAMPVGSRMSVGQLRLIFGAIAVVVGILVFYGLFRK